MKKFLKTIDMDRAEKAALEAYPVKYDAEMDLDILSGPRIVYEKGYRQAEKDTIERAVKWLDDNADEYIDSYSDRCQLMRDFIKFLEEGL